MSILIKDEKGRTIINGEIVKELSKDEIQIINQYNGETNVDYAVDSQGRIYSDISLHNGIFYGYRNWGSSKKILDENLKFYEHDIKAEMEEMEEWRK